MMNKDVLDVDNLFIHGTNAGIFSTLSRTDFKIMSPLEMIDNHLTAPMSGELVQGGYAIIGSEPIKKSKLGKTSFGKISANGDNDYTLSKIIRNYAQPANRNVRSKEEALAQFKSEMKRGFSYMFSNLNLILIYFVRARHLHDSLEEVISGDELTNLRANFEAVEQFFCFYQLLGTYIHPNYAVLCEPGTNFTYLDYSDAVKTILTYEHIVDKIIKNKIDMKSILSNPTQENLEIALTVLELPKQCKIKRWNGEEADVVLRCAQLFSLTANYPFVIKDQFQPSSFLIMSNNKSNGFKFNDILSAFVDGRASKQYFVKTGKEAENLLIGFNDRVRVFNNIVKAQQDQFKLTPLQEHFLLKNYPLILVSDAKDKIELDIAHCAEYRANEALKFGIDIKLVATDTHEHRLEIMKLLEIHQINNVEVILFADLELIKDNKKKPKTSYHHKDGSPILDPNIQSVPVATKEILTPLAKVITSLMNQVHTSETKSIQSEGLSFNTLNGFMVILGAATVALAFILLNAASLNVGGLLVTSVGIAVTLTGIGLFASNQCKSSDNGMINKYNPT